MLDSLWDRFTQSGKVEDYLRFSSYRDREAPDASDGEEVGLDADGNRRDNPGKTDR